MSSVCGLQTFVWHIRVFPYCNQLVAIRNEVCMHGKGQLVILTPADNP